MNITDHSQSESAIATLAHIIQSSEDAIFTVSLEGRILRWNPSAEAMYGYTSDEAVGRPFSMLASQKRVDEMSMMLKQLISGKAFHDIHTEHIRNDHKRIPVVLAASPVRDRNGNIISIAVTARDATDQQRVKVELRQAEELKAVGLMAATLAHEINNPISSLLNSLYLLEKQSLTQQARSYVTIANRQATQIADIVRHTLGRESATPTRVELREILEDVLALCETRIRKNSVRVTRRYSVPGQLIGFPVMLRQIFSNLVINAVDAMEQGGELTLHIAPAQNLGSDRQGIRVFIGDTGQGIDPADQKLLFEPFFTTKGENGTGLGLWVTRGLIAKHAGSIRVRSCTGPTRSGTCFAVYLPAGSIPGMAGCCVEQAA